MSDRVQLLFNKILKVLNNIKNNINGHFEDLNTLGKELEERQSDKYK